jgi:hypothetical protein
VSTKLSIAFLQYCSSHVVIVAAALMSHTHTYTTYPSSRLRSGVSGVGEIMSFS